MTELKKFTLRDNRYSLYYKRECGPVFGGGFDISISNQCNKNEDSFTSFPSSYNAEDTQLTKGDYANELLTGEKSQYFSVKDYEVYQISFE